MTTDTKTIPTPTEIDDLCVAFDGAKAAVESAQQKLSTAKGELLATVQDYGYTPAGAEKTTRLEGTLYVADATTASTMEIYEAAVSELQSELSRLRLPKVFQTLFQRHVKHSLLKDAASSLKIAIGALDEDTQNRILGIFATCIKANTKAPALTVDLASALREKEHIAACKAAKMAERQAKRAAKNK